MRQERLNLGLFLRIGISLLPIIFGMPSVAMVMCAYNIAVSFILCGPLTSVVSALASVCISMFFFGAFGEGAKVQGLFLAIESVLCAAACVYAIVIKRDFFTGVWLSTAGFLVPSFLSTKYAAAAQGMSVAQYLTDMPIAVMREQLQLLFTQNAVEIDLALLERLIEQVHNLVVAIIPAMLVLSSIVVGYVVMWLVALHQRRVPGGVSRSFSHIKIPITMVIAAAAAFLIAVANVQETVTYVALNAFLILLGICFFAGVSFIDFYLKRGIRNRAVRCIIHITSIMFSSMLASISIYVNLFTVYAVIAAVDAFADFRKLRRNVKKEEFDETVE